MRPLPSRYLGGMSSVTSASLPWAVSAMLIRTSSRCGNSDTTSPTGWQVGQQARVGGDLHRGAVPCGGAGLLALRQGLRRRCPTPRSSRARRRPASGSAWRSSRGAAPEAAPPGPAGRPPGPCPSRGGGRPARSPSAPGRSRAWRGARSGRGRACSRGPWAAWGTRSMASPGEGEARRRRTRREARSARPWPASPSPSPASPPWSHDRRRGGRHRCARGQCPAPRRARAWRPWTRGFAGGVQVLARNAGRPPHRGGQKVVRGLRRGRGVQIGPDHRLVRECRDGGLVPGAGGQPRRGLAPRPQALGQYLRPLGDEHAAVPSEVGHLRAHRSRPATR